MGGVFWALMGVFFSVPVFAATAEEPVMVVAPQAISTDSIDVSPAPAPTPAEKFAKDPKLETLSLPTTPALNKFNSEKITFFYNFSESISVRVGAAADIKEINRTTPEDKEYSTAFSFKYLFPSDTYRHFEVGLDYLTQPKLYLTGLYRFIYNQTEKLRPVLGAGLSMRFDEGDKFETPFTFNSYSIYLNAGLENYLQDAKSLRLDLDVHYGNRDFLALLAIGYSWGF